MPTRAAKSRQSAKPTGSSISEVAPGVFVGGRKDASSFSGTRICVLDERPDGIPPATHVPIYDGGSDRIVPKNLDRVAQLVGAARARGEPVLVFCGHGVRRSPLAAAWYLRRTEGLSLDAAYARIRTARPQIETAREWVGDPAGLDLA
jgi:histidinol-phosphate aminotransferase